MNRKDNIKLYFKKYCIAISTKSFCQVVFIVLMEKASWVYKLYREEIEDVATTTIIFELLNLSQHFSQKEEMRGWKQTFSFIPMREQKSNKIMEKQFLSCDKMAWKSLNL